MVLLLALAMLQRADLVVADFELADYAGWQATGTAFGPGPAQGTLPNQMVVTGFQGKGLVNTFVDGDRSVGTLTSPEFRIERKSIEFLIGGGYDPQKLRLELLIDGKAVRWATGKNRVPGGSEALAREGWSVADFQGKRAKLRIVDLATGGWGHINVDHIVQTDRKPPMTLRDVSRTLRLDRRFLNIPIKNGAPMRKLTLKLDDGTTIENNVELADGQPDWWACIEVGARKGKTLTLKVDELASDSKALASITTSDEVEGAYREPMRGQFHFSPRRGWTNDPNGLVYFNGEYHLFFQHNPYGWGWGNMHWGHAVSTDLVHWQELPIALHPDSLGTIFSGSAVVDVNNSSSLGVKGKPPMLLFYTYANGYKFCQGLAYSLDGRSFTKWTSNPIIQQIGGGDRDPKVFYHEPSKHWVMVLYVDHSGTHSIEFLVSNNLTQWTRTSRVDGFYECPDFFELPIRGTNEKRWVLTAANSNYQVGTFDGRTFKAESPILTGHRGRGFYAAQTYSDTPGRRIQIGWFQTETKGMPFNQSMSIPMELGLVRDTDGYRLTWTPVEELKRLRTKTIHLDPALLKPGAANPFASIEGELFDVEMSANVSPDTVLEFELRGVNFSFDAKTHELAVEGLRVPVPRLEGKLSLRFLIDRTGFEVFGQEGRVFVPLPINLSRTQRALSLRVNRGEVECKRLEVAELRSAWP